MLKKLLISTVLIAGILSPAVAQAAQASEPMAVHTTANDFKPISPFVQDPYDPLTIFPPTE